MIVAKDQLRSYIERIENMNNAAQVIADDKRDIFAEAKANGFCPATLRTVIKLRSEDKDKRAARESLLEIYLQALGQLPLFQHQEAAE